MKETWKQVPFAPKYEVSSLGQVRNKNGRILKQRKMRHMYIMVPLRTEPKKWKYFSVHRTVAAAFLGLDIDDKNIHVHHINQVTADNRLDNLRVVTVTENMRARIRCDIDLIQWIIDRSCEGMSAKDILKSI